MAQFQYLGGSTAFQANASVAGNNTTTYPLAIGEYLQFDSEPFYLPAGFNGNNPQLQIIYTAAAAGTAGFELSRAYFRAVDPPQ